MHTNPPNHIIIYCKPCKTGRWSCGKETNCWPTYTHKTNSCPDKCSTSWYKSASKVAVTHTRVMRELWGSVVTVLQSTVLQSTVRLAVIVLWVNWGISTEDSQLNHWQEADISSPLQSNMQRPLTLEEVTGAIRAFKAQMESSSQRPQQHKVCCVCIIISQLHVSRRQITSGLWGWWPAG